ncbi:hypothetical protein KAFR_0B04730 [Kazachstania africana CBS 2517]|uniref:GOLD domain-containing protein n=1 Tax=Kazachstania africana (strain ATCC 22294 / BCRC 22015 / CBS 2517 / CECT 1963 / NBRC 1671 / NRRL Y-8276) TaxID=1071382 RepID=H2AQX0_KAZAF|nr:hypothetical protein KAFR_0B04730 [Kazachstania africana CBS 2517]CCF56770.1 hypothetical protein KAFR_0B04730 [Kazachstania africana CBS 2517]
MLLLFGIVVCWLLSIVHCDRSHFRVIDNTLTFKVAATKYHDDTLGPMCVNIPLPAEQVPYDYCALMVGVEDKVSFRGDTSRFGGTSDSRGKQSIDMEIHGLPSGNLIRKKRRVKNGINFVSFKRGQDDEFRFCFVNLVYDYSWNSIDVDKEVKIIFKNKRKEYLKFLKKHFTPELSIILNESVGDLRTSAENSNKTSCMMRLERQRRDLNESTYNWLFYGITLFTMTCVSSNVFILYYIRKKLKQRQPVHLHARSKSVKFGKEFTVFL